MWWRSSRSVAVRAKSAKKPRKLWFDTLEDRTVLSSTTFAVIGDYGSASTSAAANTVGMMINTWSPDFIATVGDNMYLSSAQGGYTSAVGSRYQSYLTGGDFYPSLGNHEYTDLNSGQQQANMTAYLNYFFVNAQPEGVSLQAGGRYYTYTRGPVQVFVIDSGSTDTGSLTSAGSVTPSVTYQAEKDWLTAQAAASTAPWKIVTFHHSPYSDGQRHGSLSFMQWDFKGMGINAVLSGHNHVYEHLKVNGLDYVLSGLGGESVDSFKNTDTTTLSYSLTRYNGTSTNTTAGSGTDATVGNGQSDGTTNAYGALRVDATDTTLQFRFYSILNFATNNTGTLRDQFTLTAAVATPTVTVTAPDASAAEQGQDPGSFVVTRSSTTGSLTVNLAVSGTATNGTDYTPVLPTSVTFPDGVATASFTVTPADDSLVEGAETVILSIASGSSYSIGVNSSATITIADNDVADTTPPDAPTPPMMSSDTDTGWDGDDGITRNTTPRFTGSAEAGSTVRLYKNGDYATGHEIGTGVATGGAYSITVSALAEGEYTITARASDAAGNTSSFQHSGIRSLEFT